MKIKCHEWKNVRVPRRSCMYRVGRSQAISHHLRDDARDLAYLDPHSIERIECRVPRIFHPVSKPSRGSAATAVGPAVAPSATMQRPQRCCVGRLPQLDFKKAVVVNDASGVRDGSKERAAGRVPRLRSDERVNDKARVKDQLVRSEQHPFEGVDAALGGRPPNGRHGLPPDVAAEVDLRFRADLARRASDDLAALGGTDLRVNRASRLLSLGELGHGLSLTRQIGYRPSPKAQTESLRQTAHYPRDLRDGAVPAMI
jgi:hypothetical protein